MNYIQVTKENIDKEHICCAMSNNQSLAKKEWMKARFEEGLVFLKSEERGKCFIEYVPAQNAWVPIVAKDYMYINCLWVSGSLKGHGYSNDLLAYCMQDAKDKGYKGVCILSSTKRKKEFLSDPKYLVYKGFQVADTCDCDISLMYLPFVENAPVPKFKECAKTLRIPKKGFVLFYTDQCPFTKYWVNRVQTIALENGVDLHVQYVQDVQTAQNMPCPVSTYALFKDGKFITHAIQSDKKFLKLVEKLGK